MITADNAMARGRSISLAYAHAHYMYVVRAVGHTEPRTSATEGLHRLALPRQYQVVSMAEMGFLNVLLLRMRIAASVGSRRLSLGSIKHYDREFLLPEA